MKSGGKTALKCTCGFVTLSSAMFEKSEVNAVLNQFNRAKSFIDKDGVLVRLSVVKDDQQLVFLFFFSLICNTVSFGPEAMCSYRSPPQEGVTRTRVRKVSSVQSWQ